MNEATSCPDEEISQMLDFYQTAAEFHPALAKLPLQSEDSGLTSSDRSGRHAGYDDNS